MNGCAFFFDQQPASILLLLQTPVRIADELGGFSFIDGVQELRTNASEGVCLGLIRLRVRPSRLCRRISFGCLLTHEFVEDLLGCGKIHWCWGFNPRLQS